MKIFDLIKELETSIEVHAANYSDEYVRGNVDALNDLKEKIMRRIHIEVKNED